MAKIVQFPIKVEEKEYTEATYDWLVDRIISYLGFLKRNAIKEHKTEWCRKFVAVLKFLGDYKLESEIRHLE